jgi:NAD(P)-dependent dehydrogenase (short-subunit alcohol dehydrogenase family)
MVRAIKITPTQPILVTGASSGIGKLVTEVLARRGQRVYACARKNSDIKKLNEIDNVTSFRLDVTSPSDVQKVAHRVKQEGKGLYGLVNNAGVVESWPICATSEEMLHRVFNVNVYGPLRITNALISFLLESQGRIVNISSVSGLVTPQFLGTYSMSKHALEAWSNALSQELQDYQVRVSIIEPGNYKTSIVDSVIPILLKRFQETEESLFQKEIESILSQEDEVTEKRAKFLPPDEVADAVLDALFNRHPKLRYLVVSQLEPDLFTLVLKYQFTKVLQLLKDNTHRFTVTDLRNLLDEVINESQ